MFILPHFDENSWDAQAEIINQFPLATIVTKDESGGIFANHIPFLLYVDPDTNKKYLRAHVNKKNTQLEHLREGGEALLIFQSPNSYVTPSWYPSKQENGKVVPTWDFASVHCYGVPTVQDDPDWVYTQLTDLSKKEESSRQVPWSITETPKEYLNLLQKSITGLEIEITKIESKFKLHQNKGDKDFNGVMKGHTEEGGTSGEILSKLSIDTRERNAKH